jgi:sigma-B regulation protein RsbU (phosphoserine phosphatase)
MTTNDHLTLQRLLDRRDAATLLNAIHASAPHIALALARVDGTIFVCTENWDAAHIDLTDLRDQVETRDEFRLYPLRADAHLLGALVARGASPTQNYSLEHALHTGLTTILAHARARRDVATEALERYREINLMYRVSETIGASFDARAIPQMVLDESHRVIHADAGIVMLAHEASWQIQACAGVDAELNALLHSPASQTWFADKPAIITELRDALPAYRAILWSPLKAQDHFLGGILLGRKDGAVFTASDEKLLSALARQAAIALENTRLHQAELDKQRMAHELQLARDVQASLIPSATPEISGWDFAAEWQPAREVAGDFYDFFASAAHAKRSTWLRSAQDAELKDAESPDAESVLQNIVIADVSDKGMHAALFMALTRSTVRASTLSASSPAEGITQANSLLCADATGGMFVTLFFAQLDPRKNEIVYVNAGHNPPLLYRARDQELSELNRTGIMLGFMEGFAFQQRAVALDQNDFIVFYTDGVTEAINATNEQFGEERLRAVVLDQRAASPGEMLSALQNALRDFIGDTAPFDDVTIVIAKRL